jgi:ferredoxin
MGMKVWIDQDLCTGDGICVEMEPQVLAIGKDGLAYVKDGKKVLKGGPDHLAPVPPELEEKVIACADECPGECIFIEVE